MIHNIDQNEELNTPDNTEVSRKVYKGILWVFPDVKGLNIYKVCWNVCTYLKRSNMTIYRIFNQQNTKSGSPEQSYGFSLTNQKYGLKSKFQHTKIHSIA